jgi:hypothetical protein
MHPRKIRDSLPITNKLLVKILNIKYNDSNTSLFIFLYLDIYIRKISI